MEETGREQGHLEATRWRGLGMMRAEEQGGGGGEEEEEEDDDDDDDDNYWR
jgi:hypothetical protein